MKGRRYGEETSEGEAAANSALAAALAKLLRLFGPFLPNRVVDPGRYTRIVAALEWKPDVQMGLTRERIGGTIRSEIGFGDFTYQRTEAAITTRSDVGEVRLIGRLYGGMVTGTPVTQQLFEIGSSQNLPG